MQVFVEKLTSKWLALLLAAVLFSTAAGCSDGVVQSTQQQAVRVGVLRIDDSIPLHIADRDGLFEQCGVDVELVEFGSASDQMKAAEAGEIDLLMTDLVVPCLLKKGGADFKAVTMALGADQSEGRFLIVSAPDSGILEPEDLYGATIAISENTMMDYLVEQYEAYFDLDSSEIGKQHIPSLSLRLDALLSGQVQAAILPDPLAAYSVSKGANVVIDDTQLALNLSQSVFAVSTRLTEEKPELVEKLVKAIGLAMEAINNAPEQYREYCLEVANVPAEIAGNYQVPSYTPNTVPGWEDVRSVTDWMVSRGLLSEAYSYEQLVDDSFIN